MKMLGCSDGILASNKTISFCICTGIFSTSVHALLTTALLTGKVITFYLHHGEF
ncbi:hypothetical protein NEF87_000899 [Candidatus Lokiarchaeum ossiferum]|uniref:Uncharacterized protein n=1 Tax=Candidatus Lokiarchaeum ossiferum TaxID=2951803 RepID=A0ABY6HPW6_9ARCH|nr:hypothetical protein NEF87_000899 [Candidatus Lokiarchaeum sp. B-35]